MVTSLILRVGDTFRIKFAGDALGANPFTHGCFTPEELDELGEAVRHARMQIAELRADGRYPEAVGEILARYEQKLQLMTRPHG